MPRPIWSGQIAFGLVSVPVSLHTAERRSDLQFRLLDSRDRSRVRYERVNEIAGSEVPWDKVVKAYEFCDDDDAVYLEKPYDLVPEKHGAKGYALLRETLRRTKRVGVPVLGATSSRHAKSSRSGFSTGRIRRGARRVGRPDAAATRARRRGESASITSPAPAEPATKRPQP